MSVIVVDELALALNVGRKISAVGFNFLGDGDEDGWMKSGDTRDRLWDARGTSGTAFGSNSPAGDAMKSALTWQRPSTIDKEIEGTRRKTMNRTHLNNNDNHNDYNADNCMDLFKFVPKLTQKGEIFFFAKIGKYKDR